jgi:hypothetical protein
MVCRAVSEGDEQVRQDVTRIAQYKEGEEVATSPQVGLIVKPLTTTASMFYVLLHHIYGWTVQTFLAHSHTPLTSATDAPLTAPFAVLATGLEASRIGRTDSSWRLGIHLHVLYMCPCMYRSWPTVCSLPSTWEQSTAARRRETGEPCYTTLRTDARLHYRLSVF